LVAEELGVTRLLIILEPLAVEEQVVIDLDLFLYQVKITQLTLEMVLRQREMELA
jgi:hypothetical protein